MATVDAGERLRHPRPVASGSASRAGTIEFSDESTPTRKAKPAGVLGAEIWVKIGPTPPVDPGELTFLAVDTRTPYMTEFDGAEGGKTAQYMLRWINSKAETGPPALDGPQRTKFATAKRALAACQGWSQTVSATIGA